MDIFIAKKQILDQVLNRKKKESYDGSGDVDLNGMFRSILKWANEFVPSESGSILLDDPFSDHHKKPCSHKDCLYFVACFGRSSENIAGTCMDTSEGIAGVTYKTGQAYISKNVNSDTQFFRRIDDESQFKSKSIICVPVKIENITIGVIELINKKDGVSYSSKDLALLEIFAGYTSTLIQNTLDAKILGELSVRDNLTGLHNDRYFFDAVTKEVQKAVKAGNDLSLMFLDLDHFKSINDSHGHLVGSKVLQEVGYIMKTTLADSNCIMCRYGGDEFIVIMPNTSIKDSAELAELLRENIEKKVFTVNLKETGKKALKIKNIITASIGVASLKKNTSTKGDVKNLYDLLIKHADKAMYLAKDDGKNKVVLAKGKRISTSATKSASSKASKGTPTLKVVS